MADRTDGESAKADRETACNGEADKGGMLERDERRKEGRGEPEGST